MDLSCLCKIFFFLTSLLLYCVRSCLIGNQVRTVDLLQLENNVEFHEFLEVHKSKSNKSAWANDIVLPDKPKSEKHKRKKDKRAYVSVSSDVDGQAATETTSTTEVEQKKKLSDLEVSFCTSAMPDWPAEE